VKDLLPIAISAVIIGALVVALSRRFALSSRYERKPKVHTPWSAQDHGIDPTDESHR
jgi:H+/Cl- antiporter ClcA